MGEGGRPTNEVPLGFGGSFKEKLVPRSCIVFACVDRPVGAPPPKIVFGSLTKVKRCAGYNEPTARSRF